MNRLITDLIASFSYCKQGFSLAFQKGMRAYVLVPIFINVILFSGMTYLLYAQLSSWLAEATFALTLPQWISLLQPVVDFIIEAAEFFIWLLALALLIFFTTSTFTAITNLIGAPFNGLLAERAEASYRDLNYPNLSISQLLGRTVMRELTKLRYWLLRLVGLFFLTLLLSLIPLLNMLSPALWFLFGAWMLGIQYLDIAADNNGIEFKESLRRFKAERAVVLGFGLIVMGTTIIPIINLIIVPVAICSATTLWVKRLDLRETH